MLAEAPQFSAGDIALILLVLLGMALLVVAAAVLGFVWAVRAGRGSRQALAGWLTVAALEAALVLSLVPALGQGKLAILLPLGLLAGQALVYWRARSRPPE